MNSTLITKLETFRTKLKKTDIVLEIGSGSAPWVRSDVLLDRFYIDETGQRGGAAIFKDNRPMIVAAGERLPFKDKSFDFIYCNHVIEHAEDIGAMLSEMSRVGRSGFIECPNPLLEQVLDQKQHNWYVSAKDGKLYATRKSKKNNLTTEYDRFYFHMMSDHYIIRNYWNYFVNRIEWNGAIDFEISDDINRVISNVTLDHDISSVVEKRRQKVLRSALIDAVRDRFKSKVKTIPFSAPFINLYKTVKKLKRKARSTRVSNLELDRILACPYCRKDLQRNKSSYTCKQCSRHYDIWDGVAVFL